MTQEIALILNTVRSGNAVSLKEQALLVHEFEIERRERESLRREHETLKAQALNLERCLHDKVKVLESLGYYEAVKMVEMRKGEAS